MLRDLTFVLEKEKLMTSLGEKQNVEPRTRERRQVIIEVSLRRESQMVLSFLAFQSSSKIIKLCSISDPILGAKLLRSVVLRNSSTYSSSVKQ